MFIVEVYDSKKRDFVEIPETLKHSKKEAEYIVSEMNRIIDQRIHKNLPVKYKYRFKKVKSNRNRGSENDYVCGS